MTTAAERKAAERARKRAAGWVLVQEWVPRALVEALRRQAERLRLPPSNGVTIMERPAEANATGGLSDLNEVIERLRSKANGAYGDCLTQLRSNECLGWEAKVAHQAFGEAELKAHCAAAEHLGRHRAFQEVANLLEALLRSNTATR